MLVNALFSATVNAIPVGSLVYVYKDIYPARAIGGAVAGAAASSLFQTYYPQYCHQIRESCGERFDKAVQWLYPGFAFLGGFLGGLPNEINILFGYTYFLLQWVTGTAEWDNFDRNIEDQMDRLSSQAEKAIKQGRITEAENLIEQADKIEKTSIKPIEERWFLELPQVKNKLIEAFLELKTPDIDKAEKWALSFSSPELRLGALSKIGMHLVKNRGEKSKIEKLLSQCTENLTLSGLAFLKDYLKVLLNFGVCYEEPKQVKLAQGFVLRLEQSEARGIVYEVIREGHILGHSAFVKDCIEHFEKHFLSTLTPERASKDLCFFIYAAGDTKNHELAERLLERDELKGEDRIKAEITLASAYGKDKLTKASAHAQKAKELIGSYSLPTDTAEREEKTQAFRDKYYKALLQRQLAFDPEGAVALAKEIERKKGTLNPAERLLLLQALALSDPEAAFLSFEGDREAFWEKQEPLIFCSALLALARARLKRNEFAQAKELSSQIKAKASEKKLADISLKVVQLDEEIKKQEPPKKKWYS